MIFLDAMLSKLTDVFKKTKDSNIGKLISIVTAQFDAINTTLETMEEWREIDNAKGAHLDRIGEEIVGEYRGTSSDEEYRLKIKTRIVANFLSRGDIETINKLLQIYLGDHLVSVQSGWSLKEGPFAGEPAMLIVRIKGKSKDYGVPFEQLARVVTGGVGIQWQYLLESDLTIQNEYERWMYPFEYYAGNLIAGEEQVTNDNALYHSSLEISQFYSKTDNPYLVCGDYVSGNNGNASYASNVDMSGRYPSTLQSYPICGDFVAGEVI